MEGEGEKTYGSSISIFHSTAEGAVLGFEFVLGDAHEFAGGVGGGEAGDGFEFVVVDLFPVMSMEIVLVRLDWAWMYLGLGLEALPGEGEVLGGWVSRCGWGELVV